MVPFHYIGNILTKSSMYVQSIDEFSSFIAASKDTGTLKP